MERVILSLLFPFASRTQTGMFAIIAYIVGAFLVSLLSFRTFRFVKQRRSLPAALPKPVSDVVASKSPLTLGRVVRWIRPGWITHRPWIRAAPVAVVQQAESKKSLLFSGRNSSVELLPTTGPPPCPEAIPMPPPVAQLVDIVPPCTPPPTGMASSGFPVSFHSPSSSSSSNRHTSPIIRPKSVVYSAGRRPSSPSPHALLATTPPQRNHKRTRSLGGVPVRRLSSGHSGLRNEVDLELQELLPGRAKTISREQLLVDFARSPSSELGSPSSPSESPVHARTRAFPLDMCDSPFEDEGSPLRRGDDEWKWFGPAMPTRIRSYDARSASPRVPAWDIFSNITPVHSKSQMVAPLPLPLPKTEKLIDVALDNYVEQSPVSPIRTLELEESSVPLVDPFGDDFAIDKSGMLAPAFELVEYRNEQAQDTSCDLLLIQSSTDRLLNDEDVAPSQVPTPPEVPLATEDLHSLSPSDTVIVRQPSPLHPAQCLPSLVNTTDATSEDENTANATTSPLEEDPWCDLGSEIASDTADVSVVPQEGLVENSPGGSLLPTLMDDQVADEEVPELDLDFEGVPSTLNPTLDDSEEDTTPKATPASVKVELLPDDDPPLADSFTDVVEIVEAQSAEEYPDPDLLPLPDFECPPQYFETEPKVLPRLQMPTPPASPPSMSPLRLSPIPRTQVRSASSSPVSPKMPARSLPPLGSSSKVASPTTPPLAVFPSPSLSLTVPDVLDDGATPIAVNVNETIWATPPSKLKFEQVAIAESSLGEESEHDEILAHKVSPHVEKPEAEFGREPTEEDSLPGTFPSEEATPSSQVGKSPASTIGARLAASSGPSFRPSTRAIIRQPLEIALAMQLRPGLGAGADPAWMVRFLMSMFGWLAVVVSGQAEY